MTRWEIEAGVEATKEGAKKDLKLCPIARDYCLIDKCALARKYKYKNQEVQECTFISLVRLLLKRRTK